MTAESFPSYESNDNVRELRVVKARRELSARAVPPVLEWGPAKLRASEQASSKPSLLEENPHFDFDDN